MSMSASAVAAKAEGTKQQTVHLWRSEAMVKASLWSWAPLPTGQAPTVGAQKSSHSEMPNV